MSLYAATKKANELMAHSYSHLYGMPATGLRFFTVYGPWGRPDMSPMLFTRAMLEGRPIKVFNYGKMRRDFTYVDDIVEGVVRVLARPPAPWRRAIAPARDLQHRQPHRGRARNVHQRARAAARRARDQGISSRCSRATFPRRTRRSSGSPPPPASRRRRRCRSGLAQFRAVVSRVLPAAANRHKRAW